MTHPRTQDSDVHGRPDGPTDEAGQPRTTAELRSWVRRRLGLSGSAGTELFQAIEQVVANQRQLIEESKHEAIRALSEGFAAKLEKLHHQLSEKDVTVSNIARYFEDVVADLTEKSHRDPKTKLLNFDWFMERVESFLAVEQRVRWCGVGVVDITSFKWYNDTLGHALGDRIIERVARILSDQIRSAGLPGRRALERGARSARQVRWRRILLPDPRSARVPGSLRHRRPLQGKSVESYEWRNEDDRLGAKPVGVDVGVVCLRLGPVSERRGVARKLAAELIHRADTLMYEAKSQRSTHVHSAAVRVENSALVDASSPSPATTEKHPGGGAA